MRLVDPVVPEAATTVSPAACAPAIDVPPVPTAGSPAAAAAAIAFELVSAGSQLTSTRPSISPAATWAASAASAWRAAALICSKVPSIATSGHSCSSSTHSAAGVDPAADSIDEAAATNCTAATVSPAVDNWRMISLSSPAGSSPPCDLRLPPLLPMIATLRVPESMVSSSTVHGERCLTQPEQCPRWRRPPGRARQMDAAAPSAGRGDPANQ
ncbi:hypothetical protein SDC9_137063 [bioreactor metagenome]|uniref:Uncharacterized protein n=1 Tax=bioreactor metagenome TaxID=1076179 RepID=A0A645DLJ8_9ZZZZ